MKRVKTQPHLNVILWGRVAAKGQRILQKHLETPCRFFAFPEPAKDGTLPARIGAGGCGGRQRLQ